jgi:hypothetical protein
MGLDYAESNVFNPQGASGIASIETTIKTFAFYIPPLQR